jgi:hypothetical protein
MNTKTIREAIILVLAALLLPLSLANGADLQFNGNPNNEVGKSPASINVAPGGTFTLSVQVVLGPSEPASFLDYWLWASTSGIFSITNRDLTGSAFPDGAATNAEVTSSPGNQLSPVNGVDLGGGTGGAPVTNGTFQAANYTLQLAANAVPGTYEIRTLDYAGWGLNDVTPAHQASIFIVVPVSAQVTVGTLGNEPVITFAPDGTLYISALQHFYRSTDGGAHWSNPPGPPESQVNLNTDSSLSVDPGNRVYFTFDYPYAGTTAVCTSDDKGDTWACDPAVVPGGTDRMWVVAPTNSTAYEVTNQGLYQTAFLTSTDRGTTWTPTAVGSGTLEPQTGPLLQSKCSTKVIQPIKIFGTLPSDVPELKLYVFDPNTTGALLSDVRPTGLGLPTALPSGAFGYDGVLYVCSEESNAVGGRQVVVARSSDEGVTWTKLPPIPATTAGTATFTWVAAGAPGHVGVIYYYTLDNGADPATLVTSNWSAVWAESYNADSATPTWTVTTLDNLVHTGAICAAAGCMGTDRFAGDFITAVIDPTGAAHLAWMKQDDAAGATSIHYQRIQSGPPSIYEPPACGELPLPVQLNAVVSRKVHGGAGPFDIDLPVTGDHGIECRDGGVSGDYTLIFTFSNPLHSVDSANVSSGTGNVSSSAIDSTDSHKYVVNLTGVTNAQPIFVALHNVHDEAGRISDTISAPMSILVGDVNANKVVSNTDVSSVKAQVGAAVTSSNFRNDVNANGVVSNTDVSATKAQVGTSLP